MVEPPPPATAVAELAGRVLVDAEQRVPLRHTLAALTRAATTVLDVDAASVSLVEGDGLRLLAASTPELEALERAQEETRAGAAHRAAAERRTVSVELPDGSATRGGPGGPDGPTADAESDGWTSAAAAAGWRAALAVPVTARGRAWAVLTVYRRRPGPLPDEERTRACALADLAAAAAVLTDDRDAAVRRQQALAHQALHDGLTGLANRTLLLDRLQHELLVSTRRRTPLAVLFVDLDGFKEVNDTLGHAAGDELLVGVAQRLTSVLRAQDTVARIGGDEFVAVCADLPADLTDEAVAGHVAALAGRLARVVAEPAHRLGSREVSVTASVGSVVASPGQATAQSLLRDADTAMYRAKRARSRAPVAIDLRDQPERPPVPGRAPPFP